MECRADAIRLDSQSGGHIGKDRKVSSAAGGNLSRMHKTEKTAKESRVNLMYSHLCDGTLAVPLIRGNFNWLPSQCSSAYSLIDRLFSRFRNISAVLGRNKASNSAKNLEQ